MAELHSPHDNIDVRINSKIAVYGNVTMVGSISVASVGFLFLGIWITNHWAEAVKVRGQWRIKKDSLDKLLKKK